MARVRDVLYRFRPTGSPGPASSAAVPADREADRAAELAPVFDLLEDTEARCAALREQGVRDAEERTRRAAVVARSLLADAQSRSAGERADAAAAVTARAVGESAAILDAARADAELLLARSAERTPSWVARVVDEVEGVWAPAPAARP